MAVWSWDLPSPLLAIFFVVVVTVMLNLPIVFLPLSERLAWYCTQNQQFLFTFEPRIKRKTKKVPLTQLAFFINLQRAAIDL